MPKQNSHFPLMTLAPELLVNIALFLPISDFFRFRQVCLLTRDLFDGYNNKILLKNHQTNLSESLEEALFRPIVEMTILPADTQQLSSLQKLKKQHFLKQEMQNAAKKIARKFGIKISPEILLNNLLDLPYDQFSKMFKNNPNHGYRIQSKRFNLKNIIVTIFTGNEQLAPTTLQCNFLYYFNTAQWSLKKVSITKNNLQTNELIILNNTPITRSILANLQANFSGTNYFSLLKNYDFRDPRYFLTLKQLVNSEKDTVAQLMPIEKFQYISNIINMLFQFSKYQLKEEVDFLIRSYSSIIPQHLWTMGNLYRFALKCNLDETVSFLLNENKCPEKPVCFGKNFYTPVEWAILNNQPAMLKIFLEHPRKKANAHHISKDLNSLLHRCTGYGTKFEPEKRIEMFEMLLKHGVNPALQNSEGFTALELVAHIPLTKLSAEDRNSLQDEFARLIEDYHPKENSPVRQNLKRIRLDKEEVINNQPEAKKTRSLIANHLTFFCHETIKPPSFSLASNHHNTP